MTDVVLTGETRVNTTAAGDQKNSAVARLSNGWVVTWQSDGDIYQQRYGADGNRILGETLVNTTTTGTQEESSVTNLNDGGWIVTWTSNGDIHQQRYGADGNKVLGETLVNVTIAGTQAQPSVARLNDGGWLVTWTSNGDVYQRRYAAEGTGAAEFMVNTATAGIQAKPSVTGLKDGGWLVTWFSDGDVYQRRYTADGIAGSEVRVNTTTESSQDDVLVTALADGGWLVTWESLDQDGDTNGIYQQRYGADGAGIGGESLVNTTTLESQYDASATALADGGWLVTWTSDDQDGSMEGIYQQRYAAGGAKIGGEVRVNTTTFEAQSNASVTTLADGGWLVTWTSNDQDGDGYGIYQQRFTADGQKVGPTTPTGLSFAQPVAEGQKNLLPIGSFAVKAFDPNQGYTYTLLDNAGGRFSLSSSGTLLVNDGVRLDYEQARSHWIKVQVKDAPGAVFEQWIEIAVADVASENLTGTTGADVLKGGRFEDTFNGAGGNDRLWGGLGNDVLKGGSGKDVFVFDTKPHRSSNRDKIVDFSVKDDTFWLDNAVFTKLGRRGTEAQPSKLNKACFALETAKDRNDYIVYSKKKGVLYYDADGSGKGKAIEVATLPKNLTMTHNDFYVI